jgi:hypothetical protein
MIPHNTDNHRGNGSKQKTYSHKNAVHKRRPLRIYVLDQMRNRNSEHISQLKFLFLVPVHPSLNIYIFIVPDFDEVDFFRVSGSQVVAGIGQENMLWGWI